ncbi:FMN-binding negative transcriptional regulator [Paracraurococcus lichenis]|uniref:FMN-binding negative transcriptional regulator n=1 Tax=Paracraurococcus lichenis TaxID=3064888 RepID=A0ABT9E7S9_9PROT|nr:FMN-binding negative transcriptional regulator [Paracraurococcus sp. LOR1-02]MDO9712234.1 FMN-binding negative transcriptional regulator [Paracraurococcus sp. LOR1-02]
MYVPPAFREDGLAALHGTMREARLANLVTATAEGLLATPLPLFLAPEDHAPGRGVAASIPGWSEEVRPPRLAD